MRNDNVKRRAVLNIAKVVLLVLCFAFTFAMVMTADTLGWFGGMIADAAGSDLIRDEDGAVEIGKANPYSDPNLVSSNFTKDSGTTWKYTYTESFLTNFTPQATKDGSASDNHMVMKADGKTRLYSRIGEEGVLKIGALNTVNSYEAFVAITVTSDFYKALIQNPYLTVNVGVATKLHTSGAAYVGVWGGTQTTEVWAGLLFAQHTFDVKTVQQSSYKSGYEHGSKSKGEYTGTLTVAGKNVPTDEVYNNFVLVYGFKWGTCQNVFSPKDNYLIVDSISITYTITRNTATQTNDGSAPVWGKHAGTADSYFPNLTSVTASMTGYHAGLNYTAIKSEFAVDNGVKNQLISYRNSTATANFTDAVSTSASAGGVETGKAATDYSKYWWPTIYDAYDFNNSGGVNLIQSANSVDNTYLGVLGRKRSSEGSWSNHASTTSTTSTTSNQDEILHGFSSTTTSRISKSGLKTIAVTMTQGTKKVTVTITLTGTYGALNYSQYREFKIDSKIFAYLYIPKVTTTFATTTSLIDKVQLEFYFCDNVDVTIDATDNGNLKATKVAEMKVDGIDKTAPDYDVTLGAHDSMPNNQSAYAVTSADALNNSVWYTYDKFYSNPGVSNKKDNANLDTSVAPYLLYYTVQRADTPEGLGDPITISKYSDIETYQMTAINFCASTNSSLSAFIYDFSNGGALRYGEDASNSTAVYVGNPTAGNFATKGFAGIDRVTGAGYYRFNFYLADMAGNLGKMTSYYVKVDYVTPDATLNLSYVDDDDTNQTVQRITADNFDFTANPNVLKWATGTTTLKINLNTDFNFSGNTFRFYDNDEKNYLLNFDSTGFTQLNGEAVTLDGEGRIAFAITSHIGTKNATHIYLHLDTDERIITISFNEVQNADGLYESVGWVTLFEVYAGIYTKIDNINQESNDTVVWRDESWDKDGNLNGKYGNARVGEVHVLIDRNIPAIPELADRTGGYIFEGSNDYSAQFEEKKWFTAGYNAAAGLKFTDDVQSSEKYGEGVHIFYGIKYVTNQADLTALQALDIDGDGAAYKNYTADDNPFDAFTVIASKNWQSDDNYALDLINTERGGMRVIYVWAVDQTGRVSEAVSVYYILADATPYDIRLTVRDNLALGTKPNTEFTSSASSRVLRGQTLTISFSLSSGFVPYLVTRSENGQTLTMLENYSQYKSLSLGANAEYVEITSTPSGGDNNNNAYEFTYVFDSNYLGRLDEPTEIELSQRYVVTYDYSVTSMTYKAQPAKAGVTVSNINDATAKANAENHFRFDYTDNENNLLYVKADGGTTINRDEAEVVDGAPVLFVPVNAGNHYVRVYIPEDNDMFIASDYETDAETGKQAFPLSKLQMFTINKATVTVTPIKSQSAYGDEIVLGILTPVTNNGLYVLESSASVPGEVLTGELVLDITNFDNNGLYDVADYEIIQKDGALFTVSDNYTVIFTEGVNHTVTRRSINVKILDESKYYGDNDDAFRFSVSESEFAWYTDRGLSLTGILPIVFEHYTSTDTPQAGNYFYLAGDVFSRQSGENVGRYAITQSREFVNAGNFTITVDITKNAYMTIMQRIVTVYASGNTAVFTEADIPADKSHIQPIYRIDNQKDGGVSEQVEALVLGNFLVSNVLAEIREPFDPEQYEGQVWYKILLEDAEDDNIKCVLDDSSAFIFYLIGQGVIISILPNATISFPFGTMWTTDLITYEKYKECFTYTGIESDEFDAINWTFEIEDEELNGYIPRGNHTVKVSNVELFKDGQKLSTRAVVDAFNITVSPSTLVVRPIVQQTSKVYGEIDSVYGISYEIAYVRMGSQQVSVENGFAGYTYQQLLEALSGTFARARFGSDGAYKTFGDTFDTVTDTNGLVYGSTDYYGYYVSTSFACSNNNFQVEHSIDESQHLFISPKPINLDVKNFIGVNKTYDRETTVFYNSRAPYNIANQKAQPSDDLTLLYNAEYDNAGSPSAATKVGIIFTNFALSGNSAHNYKLGVATNDHVENTIFVNGVEVRESDIVDGIAITIYYLNNIDNKEHIQILMGQLGVLKDYFSISKQYDNSTDVFASSITLEEATDEDGYGTKVLYSIWAAEQMVLVESSGYKQRLVGGSIGIDFIKLFFPIEGAEGLEINNVGRYDPSMSGITVYAGEYDAEEGIFVEIQSISNAEITKRIINADSFDSITTVNRDYNGLAKVETRFIYKDGAIADGETTDIVGLRLMTTIDGDADVANHIKYGAGKHTVSFAQVGAKEDSACTYIDSPNYAIDIDSLNEKFADDKLEVVISKAKLSLNVNFKDKTYTYNGNTRIEPSRGSGTGDLTIIGTTSEVIDNELTFFEVDYDAANKPKYKFDLSSNGKLNPNVIVEGGVVMPHSVMVSDLVINEIGGNEYLNNYMIYGDVYDEESGKYTKKIESIKSGEKIKAYELLNALVLEKKKLLIPANNILVKDKIYDSNRDAEVIINLAGVVVQDHEDLLQVTAEGLFEKSYVRDNLSVKISNVVLSALDEAGLNIIDNYELSNQSFTNCTAKILPRPVAVTADLGQKVYNRSAQINVNAINFTLSGLLDAEANWYAVQVLGGAYYINRNVEYDADTKEVLAKSGTVYNPVLRNNKGLSNYVLVYGSTEKLGDDFVAYTDVNGEWHYSTEVPAAGQMTYYYLLPTTDKYILAGSAYLDDANKEKSVIGYYTYKVKNELMGVYLVKDSYEGNVSGHLSEPVSYIGGTGVILQKNVSIAANGIIVNPNSDAFTKMYDGTKKFFGVRGKNENEGAYYCAASSIAGVMDGDEVEIEDVFAEFDDDNTTANYVVFRPSGITGNDAYNYCIDGTIGSVKVGSSSGIPVGIIKRPIDAILKDGEMVYGTSFGTIEGVIEYKVHGADDKLYDIEVWDGGLYLPYGDYIAMMASDIDDYQEMLESKVYWKTEAGGFEQLVNVAEAGNLNAYYIKFSGITALPTVRAEFPMSKPQAGEVATSYTVVNVDVNNYEFAPVYSQGNTSVLTVVKKDLFIATDGREYAKQYGGSNPAVELYFVDENGNSGFATSETALTVFREGSKDNSPVAKFGIYNKDTNTVTPISEYAVISDMLEPNQIYIVYFEAPKGVDYATKIQNYNVHLGSGYVIENDRLLRTYSSVDETTGDVTTYSIKTTVSPLTLTLPEIGGLTTRGDADNAVTVTYDGTNLTSAVIIGMLTSKDELYIDVDGELISPVDAGTYTGYAKVFRPITVDDGDTNGYKAVWTSSDIVSIVIQPASPQFSLFGGSKYFDGTAFKYGVNGSNNMISYKSNAGISIIEGDVEFTYEMLVDNEYVPLDSKTGMRNAGVYRVTGKLTEQFATRYKNFIGDESSTVTYNIIKAVVNVTVSGEGYKKISNPLTLGATYEEGKKYEIGYTISMNGYPNDIKLTENDTRLVFEKEITSSGRYHFNVEVLDSVKDKENYNIVGAAGVLELTTKFVETANGSVSLEDDIVANRFVAHTVVEGKGNGFDAEMWSNVEQYMPYINEQAKLSAVVRLSLYYGTTAVNLNGSSVAVSVAIPESVGSLEGKAVYTVNSNGGLTRLTDYQVVDGNIEYTTDYLGALVFVDLTPEILPMWAWITIIVVGGVLGIAVIWTLTAWLIRRSRLKKLEVINA